MFRFDEKIVRADDKLAAKKVEGKGYIVELEGKEIVMPIGEPLDNFPTELGNNRLIWNHNDIGHNFCYGIWKIAGAPNSVCDGEICWGEVVYFFDNYDDFMGEENEPQLVYIFKELEKLGYIKSFTIYLDEDDSLWKKHAKSDGSIDCAIIDMSLDDNYDLLDRIQELLWMQDDEIAMEIEKNR